jgi:hypothetical protein
MEVSSTLSWFFKLLTILLLYVFLYLCFLVVYSCLSFTMKRRYDDPAPAAGGAAAVDEPSSPDDESESWEPEDGAPEPSPPPPPRQQQDDEDVKSNTEAPAAPTNTPAAVPYVDLLTRPSEICRAALSPYNVEERVQIKLKLKNVLQEFEETCSFLQGLPSYYRSDEWTRGIAARVLRFPAHVYHLHVLFATMLKDYDELRTKVGQLEKMLQDSTQECKMAKDMYDTIQRRVIETSQQLQLERAIVTRLEDDVKEQKATLELEKQKLATKEVVALMQDIHRQSIAAIRAELEVALENKAENEGLTARIQRLTV